MCASQTLSHTPFSPDELKALRADFPALHQRVHRRYPLIYLDSAATALKPRAMIEATQRYYQENGASVHRGVHALSHRATEQFEAVRDHVRDFINAQKSCEIIWTKGTTEGINLIADSFCQGHCQPGDEIVLSMMEHHANIVPWQLQAKRYGLVLKVIPLTTEGDLDLMAYQALLSHRTRLVSVSGLSNVLGRAVPLQKIIEIAHHKQIPVLVDAAQAIVHETIDVQALACDFLVFSAHKLGGPTGVGVLYAREEWLKKLSPYQGGGHMITHVSFEETLFQEAPGKFEAGTPNIVGVLGLGAVIQSLKQWGLSRIHATLNQLSEVMIQEFARVPDIRILGASGVRAPMISMVHPSVHAHDLAILLDRQGIALRDGHHCAMPLHKALKASSSLRASAFFYNTSDEIAQCVDALVKSIKII